MGRRGPAPMPTAIKKRQGTYHEPRASNPKRVREVSPPVGVPDLPDSLRTSAIARACWETLAPQLRALKLLTVIDGLALEGLCIAYARARKADDAVRAHGIVLCDPLGVIRANPAVALSRAAWAEVRRFGQEFGLTPASRTRVSASEDREGPASSASAEDVLFGGQVVGRIGAS